MPDYQNPPAVSQLLSKAQVAERYQCSQRTVDRLRKDEAFPEPLKDREPMPLAVEADP